MAQSYFTRPDKLLWKGLTALTDFATDLYSDEKKKAKARAQLAYIGEERTTKVETQLYTYDPEDCIVNEKVENFDFLSSQQESKYYWLNLHGVHNVELVKRVSDQANLDRLTIRQVLDTSQRAKVEDFGHYLSINIRSMIKQSSGQLDVGQISFVLGANYVISFQEEHGDHFEGIRGKLEEGIGFLRKRSSDYLLAKLIDAVLDNYFQTIEQLNDEIATLEPGIISNPDKSVLVVLENEKRLAQLVKKSLSPFKEGMHNILSGNSKLIKKSNLKYYKDLSNSVSAALEEVDGTLKALEGLTNIYFASLSQKMNETMKVLTTVATIFIPLTFIAGIYGMNFTNMPELEYKYGYYIIWAVMLLLAIAMVIYFKRKKWI